MMIDERLKEINCGEFEGTEETIENVKLFWQAVKHEKDYDFTKAVAKNGEILEFKN